MSRWLKEGVRDFLAPILASLIVGVIAAAIGSYVSLAVQGATISGLDKRTEALETDTKRLSIDTAVIAQGLKDLTSAVHDQTATLSAQLQHIQDNQMRRLGAR